MGITLVIHPSPAMLDKIIETYTVCLPLLRSQRNDIVSASDSVDIEALACGILLIFNPHQSQWIQTVSGQMPELAVDSAADSDTGTRTWEHLHHMMKKSTKKDIDALVDVMRLLIKGHRERILYMWVKSFPGSYHFEIWRECVLGLIRWASGEKFCQWTFLKRVLAIVVIKELQKRLREYRIYVNESVPQYDKWAYMEVNELPWLLDIYTPGSSR